MNLKTYQAATMQDALQAIKAELGPDAVILSTKQHPPGKGRLGCKMVEVTAAIDIEAVRVCVPPARHAHARQKSSVGDRSQDNATTQFGDVLRESLDRATHSALPESTLDHSGMDVNREHERRDLHAELRRIREMLESRDMTSTERKSLPPEFAPYYERLIESGLDTRTVQGLLDEVQSRMPTAVSDTLIRNALHRAIVGRIKTGGPLLTEQERKKTVILVGPTGVGKTTTIAKLAAHYRQHERRSVALVTLDTYRMAAVEQLRMYADLIGVAMDVALTRGDAVRRIMRRNDAELILVDTAGRSPGDGVGMTEVRDILSLNHSVEVHLVLSATTRERDLLQYTRHYRGVPINRLLFTKLDETTGAGGAFDLMRKTGVPLSYFCVGQRVPEDLELARPERLADFLLGQSARVMQEPTRMGIFS